MSKCLMNWCKSSAMPGKDFCSAHNFLNSESTNVVTTKKPLKRTPIKKGKHTGVDDSKLWKVFSQFIRIKDADQNGYCKCFTCGAYRIWWKMDCGHGIGRQYWGTRFLERNNHSQCKPCNGFNGGRQDIYKEKVNEIYGAGTWELMWLQARNGKTMSQFEVDMLTIHYKKEVEKLCIEKGIELK